MTARPQNELQDVDQAIERLTLGAGRLEPGAATAAAPPVAFQRILVAVDGSPRSDLAVDWAQRIGRVFGSEVWAANVVQPPDLTEHYLDALGALAVALPSDLAQELEDLGRAAVDDAAAALREAELRTNTILTHGRPAKALAQLVEEVQADLVIVGSHGRGPLGRLLLGSVADGLKNHAQASVLIAKSPAPDRHLLLATDGSRSSRRAVALGLRMARAWTLPATVMHVFEPLQFGSQSELAALRERVFGPANRDWPDPRVRFELEVGNPAEELLERADSLGAGLVVMGSRGLSGMDSFLAGSVSNRVAHQAEASVLLVKGVA